MSWSYSGDPKSSKIDEVRFRLGDTEILTPQIQDEEISFALWQNKDTVLPAAILCCRAILAKLAKQADYKIGPETVNASDRSKQYSIILADLLKDHQGSTAAPSGYIPETPNAFAVGMHDN